MRPIVLSIAVLLVLPLALAAEPARSEVPAWLADVLEARGVPPGQWAHVEVERRVLEDGVWRVWRVALADVPVPPRAAALPEVPDAVLGNVLHLMVQVGRCDGYGVEPLAGGVSKVGGSWDLGIHVVSGQGGAPGVDAHAPAESLTGATVHGDVSLAGVGAVVVQEDRFVLFGNCLLLVGTMVGAGAFAFDQTWPA